MFKKMFVVLFSIVALLTLTACADEVDEIEDKVDEIDTADEADDVEEEIVEVKPHHLEEVDEPLDGLEVHFIDTDLGEDILIRTADTTILMSTNAYEYFDTPIPEGPVPYLESQLVDEIDLLITTSDRIDTHIHLPDILEGFPTKELWLPTNGVVIYENASDKLRDDLPGILRNVVTAIEKQDISLHTPLMGETRTIGNIHLEAVESSDYSLTVKVTYGDMSYLFVGDTYGDMSYLFVGDNSLESDIDPRSTVLKPSCLSNTTEFLQAVDPKVAVIPKNTGLDTYQELKYIDSDRLDELGIDEYGTLDHGTIVISTDGKSYHIETETKPTSVDP